MKQIIGLSKPYERFQEDFISALDTLAQQIYIESLGKDVCRKNNIELTDENITFEGTKKLKKMNKSDLINMCKKSENVIAYSIKNLINMMFEEKKEYAD